MQMPMKPMLAKLTPAEGVLNRRDIVWEPKWDGYRLIAEARGALPCRLWTRAGNLVTSQYPVIAEAIDESGVECVLDGEVVVMVDGRPSFNALQLSGRMSRRELEDRMRYVVFDVLELDGQDLRSRPLLDRKQELSLLHGQIASPVVQLTPISGDGPRMWEAMELADLEGLIGKPANSPYRNGERGTWLKLKRKRLGEFAVVGWTWGKEGVTGSRIGEIGALVLATRLPDGRLLYAGKVGTGFTGQVLAETKAALEAVKRDGSPFVGAEMAKARKQIGAEPVEWVEPEYTATVEYAEMGPGGVPRFPSFKGMR
jgi:bifunctional non-homologous end joining protein LigD